MNLPNNTAMEHYTPRQLNVRFWLLVLLLFVSAWASAQNMCDCSPTARVYADNYTETNTYTERITPQGILRQYWLQ